MMEMESFTPTVLILLWEKQMHRQCCTCTTEQYFYGMVLYRKFSCYTEVHMMKKHTHYYMVQFSMCPDSPDIISLCF